MAAWALWFGAVSSTRFTPAFRRRCSWGCRPLEPGPCSQPNWLPAGCWALKELLSGAGKWEGAECPPAQEPTASERASQQSMFFCLSSADPFPLWVGKKGPGGARRGRRLPQEPRRRHPRRPGLFLFGFDTDGILFWSQIFALFPDRSIFVRAFLLSLKRIGWWGLSPGCIDS